MRVCVGCVCIWRTRGAGQSHAASANAHAKTHTTHAKPQAHARQVAANHVRPDGSTFHIVEYDPGSGAVNKRYTYQVG